MEKDRPIFPTFGRTLFLVKNIITLLKIKIEMIIFLIFKRFFCGPSGQVTRRGAYY
jgi:hypothetical protein